MRRGRPSFLTSGLGLRASSVSTFVLPKLIALISAAVLAFSDVLFFFSYILTSRSTTVELGEAQSLCHILSSRLFLLCIETGWEIWTGGRTGGWVHIGESNSGGLLHKDFGTKTQNHPDREVHPARHFFLVLYIPWLLFCRCCSIFFFFFSWRGGSGRLESSLLFKLSFVLEEKSLFPFPSFAFYRFSFGWKVKSYHVGRNE